MSSELEPARRARDYASQALRYAQEDRHSRAQTMVLLAIYWQLIAMSDRMGA